MKKINNIRKKIDIIDLELLKLLNKRAEEVLKINALKKEKDVQVYHPEREIEVLTRIKNNNKGPLKTEDIRNIFSEILSLNRSLQKTLRIGYLGPEGTFTHMAAIKKFGKKIDYIPFETISEVFDKVEKGLVDYGVVPIENSIEGGVTYTLDMFSYSPLRVYAQIKLLISHCLLGKYDKNIKKIYSHPQVFSQCRKWLSLHMPHAQLVNCDSTSQAALNAKNDHFTACIGNKILGEIYGLKILANSIEDFSYNITRFFVIAKTECKASKNDKTSVLFSIKDKVGALYDVLECFKKHRINLTRIESRPSKLKPWEYYFFIDFKGNIDNLEIKEALKILEEKCLFIKILGSYPEES